eukprot:182370_1
MTGYVELQEQLTIAEDIIETHKNLLSDGCNMKNEQDNIVKLLGGIDHILSYFLHQTKSNSNLLNPYQLEQIRQILKQSQSTQVINTQTTQFTLQFNPKNNYLSLIFGPHKSVFLYNFMYHKVTIILMLFNAFFYITFYTIYFQQFWISWTIILSLSLLIFNIWFISMILSSNTPAMKLVLR